MNPETRFSGHWIVAQQGSGKTNLLKYMIASDLQNDCSIIVMDSKGELTEAVRHLHLGARLIVFDPSEPFSINPFAVEKSEAAVSHLAYMLSGLLETNITTKQRTFLETLVQSLLDFPNPSMLLLWDMLTKGPKPYTDHIRQLSEDAQSFFFREWDAYSDTSKEVQWRLRGLLNKPIIKEMFRADTTRFDLADAMNAGKVVVIDNAQAKCTAEGSSFLGRMFVSQIWSAGTARALMPEHKKKPTFVYIDEAHIVIKKDQKIAAIIDELRAQKIGLILSHQRVGHIEESNVLGALENCAIKMVNVGRGEIDYFSKLLDIPVERMKNLPLGHFATDIRWEGANIMEVEKAEFPFRIMTPPEELAFKQRMKQLYGIQMQAAPKRAEAVPVKIKDQTAAPRQTTLTQPVVSPRDDPSKPAVWERK